MFKQLSLALVLMTFGYLASAQLPFPGHCPEVKVMTEFDLDAYTGVWYEYSKYPFIFELGKKCNYARYGDLGNSTVSVYNAAINRLTGNPSNIAGYAKVLGPARLAVVFSRSQKDDVANYLVLGTDYKNYSVVYSCSDFGGVFHIRIVWILTRERKPSAEVVDAAKKIIDANELSQTFLVNTVQDDCPAPDAENSEDKPTNLSLDSNAIENA